MSIEKDWGGPNFTLLNVLNAQGRIIGPLVQGLVEKVELCYFIFYHFILKSIPLWAAEPMEHGRISVHPSVRTSQCRSECLNVRLDVRRFVQISDRPFECPDVLPIVRISVRPSVPSPQGSTPSPQRAEASLGQ